MAEEFFSPIGGSRLMFDWSMVAAVAVAALGTSFLSGIFGMIGGLVLMGVLLLFLPVPAAMTLHAITQMTANGWRALVWREHVMWRVLPGYILGSAVVFGLLALVQFSPPKTCTCASGSCRSRRGCCRASMRPTFAGRARRRWSGLS